jgi:hypothetical protein
VEELGPEANHGRDVLNFSQGQEGEQAKRARGPPTMGRPMRRRTNWQGTPCHDGGAETGTVSVMILTPSSSQSGKTME